MRHLLVWGALACTACTDPALVDDQPTSHEAVTVHVRGRRFPARIVEGVDVLFSTADGELVARTVTDATGTATGHVDRGGSVTIVEAAAHRLVTVIDLRAGDDITVGDLLDGSYDAPVTMPLQLPPHPAAARYVVQGRCAWSSDAHAMIGLHVSSCADVEPLVVTARDALDELVVYLYAPAVPMAGAPSTIEGPWRAPIDFQIELTGAPSVEGQFTLERLRGGEPIYSFAAETHPSEDGAYQARHALAGGGDGTLAVFELPHLEDGTFYYLDYRPEVTTASTADVAASDLARIREVSAHDAGLSWVLDGPDVDGSDGMIANLDQLDDDDTLTRWTFVLPPGTQGDLRVPALPGDLAAVWTGRYEASRVFSADTPADGYREFLRDAELQWPFLWMHAPAHARTIRVSAW